MRDECRSDRDATATGRRGTPGQNETFSRFGPATAKPLISRPLLRLGARLTQLRRAFLAADLHFLAADLHLDGVLRGQRVIAGRARLLRHGRLSFICPWAGCTQETIPAPPGLS